MSTTLHLRMQKNIDGKNVINEYYNYVREKQERLLEDSTLDIADTERVERRRERALNRYNEDPSSVHIWEQVFGDYAAADSWDEFRELFPPSPTPSVVCDPKKLERACEILGRVKEELKAMGGGPERSDGIEYTPGEQEWIMETQIIALCEFAAKERYCLSFSN